MTYSKIKEHKGKQQDIQKNDPNLKQEIKKIKQIESNFDIGQLNPKCDINAIAHEYPKEIKVKHLKYELINIL